MADLDSNRFPFINLEKSIARAKQLFDGDTAGRAMRVVDAFTLWGYSAKSSGGFQTISALKMYGLLTDSGANEERKVQITDAAKRYFKDERPEEQAKLLKQFALSPRFVQAVWKEWGAAPPVDPIARSQLKLDWKLEEQSARSFLGIYKENLNLAALGDGGTIAPVVEDVQKPETPPPPPPPGAKPEGHRHDDPPTKKVVAVELNERVVFSEEAGQAQYLKLIASGDMDDALLEALESYVARQRARLKPTAAQLTVAADASKEPTN